MSHLDFDFDLFFYPTDLFDALFNLLGVERKEYLIHIATAGGEIPSYVHENSFNRRMRYELKNNQIELDGPVRINPKLRSILELSLDSDLDTDKKSALDIYTHDFSEYAKRNCFSFDRTHISDPLINQYHLVAAPPCKNNDNQMPNHNSPYHFSFQRSLNGTRLVLKNILEFTSDLSEFYPTIDRKIFRLGRLGIKSSIIGFAPFESPRYS